jgi:hypothetical protein
MEKAFRSHKRAGGKARKTDQRDEIRGRLAEATILKLMKEANQVEPIPSKK